MIFLYLQHRRSVLGGLESFIRFCNTFCWYQSIWIRFYALSAWSAQNITYFQVENKRRWSDYPKALWKNKVYHPNILNKNHTNLWASDRVRLSIFIIRSDSDKLIGTPIQALLAFKFNMPKVAVTPQYHSRLSSAPFGMFWSIVFPSSNNIIGLLGSIVLSASINLICLSSSVILIYLVNPIVPFKLIVQGTLSDLISWCIWTNIFIIWTTFQHLDLLLNLGMFQFLDQFLNLEMFSIMGLIFEYRLVFDLESVQFPVTSTIPIKLNLNNQIENFIWLVQYVLMF